MAEKIPMVHAITDPLMGIAKLQAHSGIPMAPQGAVHRYEAVSEQVEAGTSVCMSLGGGYGVALHPWWQRLRNAEISCGSKAVAPFPIVVQHVPVPHIGDASAADLSETSEWDRIGADF